MGTDLLQLCFLEAGHTDKALEPSSTQVYEIPGFIQLEFYISSPDIWAWELPLVKKISYRNRTCLPHWKSKNLTFPDPLNQVLSELLLKTTCVEKLSSSCRSVSQSCLTLWPNELQHTKFPCPSSSSRVCSNSCPLNWCWHPTIWSFVISFSSWLQSFQASGVFPISHVAIVLELQFQHQSFQWIFRVDFL